jgi:hypothetical protein
MMILKRNFLQNAQMEISTGDAFDVSNIENIYLTLYGTTTSFTIKFEGSFDGEHFFPVIGDKLSDYTASSTTTSTLNEGWSFDVTALMSFRANLTLIGNGNITVTATSVK